MTDSATETAVRRLYSDFLNSWNTRDAEALAALFSENGNFIGFDGSQMNGRDEILKTAKRIFDDHYTPSFTAIVREVRFLSPSSAIIRAVTGILPGDPDQQEVTANSVQSVVAEARLPEGEESPAAWTIALFQTTPAKFHGELKEKLSKELKESLGK